MNLQGEKQEKGKTAFYIAPVLLKYLSGRCNIVKYTFLHVLGCGWGSQGSIYWIMCDLVDRRSLYRFQPRE